MMKFLFLIIVAFGAFMFVMTALVDDHSFIARFFSLCIGVVLSVGALNVLKG